MNKIFALAAIALVFCLLSFAGTTAERVPTAAATATPSIAPVGTATATPVGSPGGTPALPPATRIQSEGGISPVLPQMIEPLTTAGLLDAPLVAGQPFAATFESTTVRPAANGASATTRVNTKIYRDAAGRVRREQTFYAANAAAPSPTDAPQSVTIFDPVAGWKYSLNGARRTAGRFRLSTTVRTDALFSNQIAAITRIHRIENPATGAAGTAHTLPAPVVQPLVAQTIAGVIAAGRRVTFRVPAGALGNSAATDAVYETWFAADLKLLVKCTVDNPGNGSHTLLLKTISRGGQAASLFEVPAGYTTKEMGVIRNDLPPPR